MTSDPKPVMSRTEHKLKLAILEAHLDTCYEGTKAHEYASNAVGLATIAYLEFEFPEVND